MPQRAALRRLHGRLGFDRPAAVVAAQANIALTVGVEDDQPSLCQHIREASATTAPLGSPSASFPAAAPPEPRMGVLLSSGHF